MIANSRLESQSIVLSVSNIALNAYHLTRLTTVVVCAILLWEAACGLRGWRRALAGGEGDGPR
jgi:hypothetical protein